MDNTANHPLLDPISSLDLSADLGRSSLDRQSSENGRVYEIERALADSLATFQELRGNLLERQVLEHQLAVAQDLAQSQRQQIQLLERKLVEKQQIIDFQNQRYLDRSQHFQQLFENFEVVVQSLRSELTQLKSYAWWQHQTSQTYHRYLYGSSTRDRLETTARNSQVATIESEILAQRNLSGRLDIQLATANKHIANLYTYLGETALAEKWLSDANHLPTEIDDLRTEITTLHANLNQHTETLLDRVGKDMAIPVSTPNPNCFATNLEAARRSVTQPGTLDLPKFGGRG